MKSLIKRSNILRVNENRVLYSEGQVPTDCIVVIKGCLELYKHIQGIQIKVDQNRKLIGLNECLNALKLQYNVRTTKQTQIIVINRETLLKFEPFLKKEKIKHYSIEQNDIKREVEWHKIKKSKQLCKLGIIDEVYTEISNKRKQQRIRTNSYY
ncbi:hypothetical protein FGO68_gene15334 [Halteria grandinella]|uniref:Cyclic nucleotide-binding domain-containing protein n=1 Tax=Halteria grandinella TaxID=5974 RepID=A0A8J8SXC5_HALGN|nr:hypothetical protein FGO68_gene15334 [Halteria grandinella]